MLSPRMLRKVSLRKKLVILASVGVLLPLLVLTYLQYRSLTELENKTKGAFKDGLRQGLINFQQRLKQRLENVANETLKPIDNVPPAERESYLANVKRTHPEIEEAFVFPAHSHIAALFESSRMAQGYLDTNRKYLFAHDSCATCPPGMRAGTYLFFPLPSGVAGVLLSERFVSDDLIPKTVVEIAASHTGDGPLAMAFTITDENSRVLYSNAVPKNGYLLESNFDPPFSNWKASVGLKNTNLDDLARNGFLHSAGATVLVLLFLIVGIALTLRAADREARLAQAKSNFVANVSHELKTPLSLLSLFSEILELERVKNDEKRIEYYRIIRHESGRLNKMIDNILDFSKIEAGRKTYNFAPGDMAEVIENVLSSYRYQITNSGFDIQTDIQPGLPTVPIDRDAMAQAISNLIDNAIKYSGELKQLSIKTEKRGPDLAIEIADHGIGIPRAEQARVFEKFYRVGNGLVHDIKGSGLGLALVKHIVEAHKGSIEIESEVGKGSRFTILLPLSHSPADGRASV